MLKFGLKLTIYIDVMIESVRIPSASSDNINGDI